MRLEFLRRLIPDGRNPDVIRRNFLTLNHWLDLFGEFISISHTHSNMLVDPDLKPLELPDGERRGFSTRYVFLSGTLDVYLNGALQKEGRDYVVDGDYKGYEFTFSPYVEDSIQHRYILSE